MLVRKLALCRPGEAQRLSVGNGLVPSRHRGGRRGTAPRSIRAGRCPFESPGRWQALRRHAGPCRAGPACLTRGGGEFAQANFPVGDFHGPPWTGRARLNPGARAAGPLREAGAKRRTPPPGGVEGGARRGTIKRHDGGQSLPFPERRQPLRGPGRDRRKAVPRHACHGAHHRGCVSTRRWASARMRARSCTLTGPRWSSERWMT